MHLAVNHNRLPIKQHGFSLIELSIALIIMGLLMGGFVNTLSSRIDNTRVHETKKTIANIKKSMLGYAYVNGHLPCPDCITTACSTTNNLDGEEDRGTGGAPAGSCSTGNTVGAVPWVTLGIGDSDQWSQRYSYWVHDTFSRDGTGANATFTLSDPASVSATNPELAEIYKRSDDGATTIKIEDKAIAVIYSHGKNTYGSVSTNNGVASAIPVTNVDEIENADNDVVTFVDPMTFVSRTPTTKDAINAAGGEFDDIVIWMTETELKAQMVTAQVLP